MNSLCALSGAALILGVGFLFGRWSVPSSEVQPMVRVETVRDDSEKFDRAVLESEIAALRAELARVSASPKSDETSAIINPAPLQIQEKPLQMEELKELNPEFYEQILAEREKRRERKIKTRLERDAFLEEIDLSLMSPEHVKVHQAYREIVLRHDVLFDAIGQASEVQEEMDPAMMQEFFDVKCELDQLRALEYNALIGALGTSMGLSQLETIELTQLLRQVDTHLELGAYRPPLQIKFVTTDEVE